MAGLWRSDLLTGEREDGGYAILTVKGFPASAVNKKKGQDYASRIPKIPAQGDWR